MGFKSWWAAHRQDEREMYYHGRAGVWAFVAMSFACVAFEIWYLVHSQLDRVFDLMLILSLGQVVYFGLILRWKATR
jgi:hypothetical protein